MGCRTTTNFFPCERRIAATRLVVWLFPLPVRTAQIAMTGTRAFSIVCWDLRGGEGHHLVCRIVAEDDVEVVEVAAGRPQDNRTSRAAHGGGSPRMCKAFLGAPETRFNLK